MFHCILFCNVIGNKIKMSHSSGTSGSLRSGVIDFTAGSLGIIFKLLLINQ